MLEHNFFMNYVMNHGKMALYLVVTKIFDNRAAEQMARCTFTKLWKPCETEEIKCFLEWEHSSYYLKKKTLLIIIYILILGGEEVSRRVFF